MLLITFEVINIDEDEHCDFVTGVYGKNLREETHSDMICDCVEDVFVSFYQKAVDSDESGTFQLPRKKVMTRYFNFRKSDSIYFESATRLL